MTSVIRPVVGMSRRSMCAVSRVVGSVPLLLADSMPRALEAHVASCLRCQAEAARERSLRRDLAELRSLVEPAPSGLEADVLAGIGVAERRETKKRICAQTVAATATTAVAAALVALLARRRGHSPA